MCKPSESFSRSLGAAGGRLAPRVVLCFSTGVLRNALAQPCRKIWMRLNMETLSAGGDWLRPFVWTVPPVACRLLSLSNQRLCMRKCWRDCGFHTRTSRSISSLPRRQLQILGWRASHDSQIGHVPRWRPLSHGLVQKGAWLLPRGAIWRTQPMQCPQTV